MFQPLDFNNIDNAADASQQQKQPGVTFEVVKLPVTDWQCCDSILQYGRTALHAAGIEGHVTTAEALLKEGADVKAIDEVRLNMLVAIIFIVHSFGLSAAFKYIDVSTICIMQFSNASDVIDRNQQK